MAAVSTPPPERPDPADAPRRDDEPTGRVPIGRARRRRPAVREVPPPDDPDDHRREP